MIFISKACIGMVVQGTWKKQISWHLAIDDHIDYYDFYTKHWSAAKFRKPDALQPLDMQSLCPELCTFRSCCTKYAPEKLQTPKIHYTSVTHSDLVLHMLSNKSTVQLENGTGTKKKTVYAKSKASTRQL